jgi:hypothetical protein
MARIHRTAATTVVLRLATPVVLPATLRTSPGRRWGGHAPQDPTLVAGPGLPAATPPATGAEHDCGPPQMTGTGERSVPSAGGPYHSRPRLFLSAPCGAACPAPDTAGYQSSEQAWWPAPDALSPSGTSVLRRQRDSQPFPALLAAPRQDLTAPPRGHPGPESMLVDPPAIARSV